MQSILQIKEISIRWEINQDAEHPTDQGDIKQIGDQPRCRASYISRRYRAYCRDAEQTIDHRDIEHTVEMQSRLQITEIQSRLQINRDGEQTADNVDTADIVDTVVTADIGDTANIVDTADMEYTADMEDTTDAVDTADIRDAADTVDTADIEDTADIVDTADMGDTADTVETRDPEQIDREPGWITKITSYMNHRRTANMRSQIYSRLTEKQEDHKPPVTSITGEDHRSVAD